MNDKGYIFGLDIGTRSIVGSVGYRDEEGRFTVTAMATRFHTTRAMLDGQIHDIAKVAETVREVRKELEKSTRLTLNDVCIAAAGRILKTMTVTTEYDLGGTVAVEAEHIRNAELAGVEAAHNKLREKSRDDKESYYCVGYTVVKYTLNGNYLTNPLGHKGSALGVTVLATFLPDDVVDGLYSAVEFADLSVANMTLEPIAAMQIAIPERYRLLNLALIDIGAGTSDICITKDGSVIAYGMLPMAGDMLTEAVMKEFLVDFDEAEKIKMQADGKKAIKYKDIMGLTHSVQAAAVRKALEPVTDRLASEIASKIVELNGKIPVAAAFMVGGGGKFPGLSKKIAAGLKVSPERVALCGENVFQNIVFEDTTIEPSPLLVTPIGICLNYYEQNNNFIFVRFNGERVKLYDNGRLTIADAALGIGYPNERMFPRRGTALEFTVNKNRRIVRGGAGEAAVILLNGKEAGINTKIGKNDVIEVRESTIGTPAKVLAKDLPEYSGTIGFIVNGKKVVCPRYVSANGKLVSEYYEIKQNDDIEMLDYYTLGQVLDFIDIPFSGAVNVNHVAAVREDKVYENFSIDFELEEDRVYIPDKTDEERLSRMSNKPAVKKTAGKDVVVWVNDRITVLTGKESYIMVDVLDAVQFDTTHLKGDAVVCKKNGKQVTFTEPVSDSDTIEIFWV